MPLYQGVKYWKMCYIILPLFSKEFIIHTDTSTTHPGGVMIQNGNPVSFYLIKLTTAKIGIQLQKYNC